MRRSTKVLTLAIALSVLAAMGLHRAWNLTSIGVAYKAKVLCSGVFVSKRNARDVLESDLAVDDLAVLQSIQASVNHRTQTASSHFLGLIRRTAAYRPHHGCTLLFSGYELPEPLDLDAERMSDRPVRAQWPADQSSVESTTQINRDDLEMALDWAFSEPDPERMRRTRAIVVVHDGQILAERYAPGFDQDTPLIGWSMSKSAMHALVGVLVRDGVLSLSDPVRAPEWSDREKTTSATTVANLLGMTTGLDFDEDYGDPLADVTYMLLRAPDMAGYAADKPFTAEPGARWRYSSGATNILSRVIRRAVGEADYPSLPRRALFEPLGMSSAIVESDASGTFVGSSYMYATARDWAKLGLLYLQDGVWSGQRILPAGWVRHATTPAPGATGDAYGAHFWLKIPREHASDDEAGPLPEDDFHAVGHEGQFVTIIPSRDLVIVRLGLTRFASAWQHGSFVRRVLAALGS